MRNSIPEVPPISLPRVDCEFDAPPLADEGRALPASLVTLGRLISGFGDQSTGQYSAPVIEPKEMARGLKVTFRPLPPKVSPVLRQFTEELQAAFTRHGVTVLPWEQATSPYYYEVAVPLTQKIVKIPARLTHHDIAAVFDVEVKPSLGRRFVRWLLEGGYRVHRYFGGLKKRHRVREILRFVWWAEDHAVKYVSDHVRTQIVSIRPIDPMLADPETPYIDKLTPGLRTLVESLAMMLVGVDKNRVSLLNMNLSDTVCPRAELDHFVLDSLIPKLHAPIRPLTRGRFHTASFDPSINVHAERVIDLAKKLSPLGLLPEAVSMSQLIRRASTRDVVSNFIDGRSGVSFGFVAALEAPIYVGPREISAEEWEALDPPDELPAGEVRRNSKGRYYLRTHSNGKQVHRQIPDIWIVSSRSGAEKNNLQRDRDLVRLGFDGALHLQLPGSADWDASDIRPSYDTYVMLALALGAAIYHPEQVRDGAALVHFHGYPSADWFKAGEGHAGADNPSIACGTFEAGVLNIIGLWELAEKMSDPNVLCVIEPNHGCNFVSGSVDHLIERLTQGVQSGQIVLGGRHLGSLQNIP